MSCSPGTDQRTTPPSRHPACWQRPAPRLGPLESRGFEYRRPLQAKAQVKGYKCRPEAPLFSCPGGRCTTSAPLAGAVRLMTDPVSSGLAVVYRGMDSGTWEASWHELT